MKFVELNGLDVYQVYEDKASGADPFRPALEAMLKDARSHKFKEVLVVKVDRIARSNIHLYDLIDTLNSYKVKFIAVDQPEVSTDTPTGKALLGILGVMAELERDLIRERTKAGLARARAEGKVLGRPKLAAPPGRISELRASGLSNVQIAQELGISRRSVQRICKSEHVMPPLAYAKNEGRFPQRKKHTKPIATETDDIDTGVQR